MFSPARQTRLTLFCVGLCLLASATFAQDGVSTAGAARTKYLSHLGVLPASREVSVEDFVNYHRHEIGRPQAGMAVALDVRWSGRNVSAGGETVLQVGLSTALAHDRAQLRPVNLALVIDKSGSMADNNKLTRVKSALLTLVGQLRASDVLSIVAFDSEAQVLLPAQTLADREHVKDVIRGIEPGTSTNLSAGLMLGYREAAKQYRKGATNRVILLTDGIANRGETDPARIAQESRSYNDRGIDLSTIGVGLDLNKDLLRKLAKSGRGLFHFVADSDDIQKVFVNELQSLLSPVADEPNLTVQYDPGLKLEKVYGYQPRLAGHSVKIRLDNLNSGATEVVLMRFRHQPNCGSRFPVKVQLSYFDINRGKEVETSQSSAISEGDAGDAAAMQDESVAKNFAIALLAQSIKDMAAACEAGHYHEAEADLDTSISQASRRYPNLDDADIRRTLSMAQKYQSLLRLQNHQEDSNDDAPALSADAENMVPNGDFALGNWGFTSALPYLKPSVNCLWGVYYTIAPVFNNPQLHTLVGPEEYAAPKRPNGNEQVLYANAGGPASVVVWSAKVNCKPNTVYRLSFQSISLTPGVDSIPTFEIRVNGARSEPQESAYGRYVETSFTWASGHAGRATVSIVRMPMPQGGRLIGLSNIAMVQVMPKAMPRD
ncbi:MAG: vWA domain-containing protein [Fimbriimonadaceae bacterium]